MSLKFSTGWIAGNPEKCDPDILKFPLERSKTNGYFKMSGAALTGANFFRISTIWWTDPDFKTHIRLAPGDIWISLIRAVF